jgi:hypothetical protein
MGAPSKKLIFPFFSCAGSYRVPVGVGEERRAFF